MNTELRALEAALLDAVERRDPGAAWPVLMQLIEEQASARTSGRLSKL